MVLDETRQHFFRDLASIDDLLDEFEPKDREVLRNFILDHPDLSFRLAEILSRLYQEAVRKLKTH